MTSSMSLAWLQRWVFTSLEPLVHFFGSNIVDAIVGNSSSGLLEAPSFDTATINIGGRQKGRIRCESVVDISATEDEILSALEKIKSATFRESVKSVQNPYFKSDTARRIAENLCDFDFGIEPKSFYDG